VLAQMVGYGQTHNLPTDPLLLKAVLLTSADHVLDPDGTSGWAPKSEHQNGRRAVNINQSLSAEQGAGRVDGAAAAALYTRSASRAAPLETWRESSMRQGGSYTLDLGRLHSGQEVDSTLTWLRHVLWVPTGNNAISGEDSFLPNGTLANFTVTLQKDGRDVVNVDSTSDNLQHLSWVVAKTGNYTLDIERQSGTGMLDESYALATSVLTGEQPKPSVDLTETLSRRGATNVSPSLLRALDSTATSIPEPSTLSASIIVVLLGLRRRTR
jgi:hypothetical protein